MWIDLEGIGRGDGGCPRWGRLKEDLQQTHRPTGAVGPCLPVRRRGLPKPSIPAVGEDERQKNGNLQHGDHWVHFAAPNVEIWYTMDNIAIDWTDGGRR